jgi:hypothetical protein
MQQRDWRVHINMELKRLNDYQFWWRPTLPFDLSCEGKIDREALAVSLEKIDET